MSTDLRPHLGICTRSFDFEVRGESSDGRTLEGHAAVFNSPARIRDSQGDFDEVIMPGAFRNSLARRTPVMQFEHGRDPRVGAVPIASIEDIREDDTGLYVRARLFDNPVVEPVRQAIAGKAIKGMSYRFQIPSGGDKWTVRSGDVDLRSVYDTDTAEIGPVVFPAYDATDVAVRSLLSGMDAEERAALIRELAAADLTNLTGRSGARSSDGGDSTTAHEAPPITNRMRLDDGALRLRGILNAQ
jgi:HK97 family phage prohead protease